MDPPEIEGHGVGWHSHGPVVRRLVAVLAAATALAAGLTMSPLPARDMRREPVWSGRLRPLARAPLQSGSVVGLVVPPGTSRQTVSKLLYEAVWLRPDLRWEVEPTGAGHGPASMVTLGGAHAPTGWRRVWSSGGVTVWRP